MMDWLLLRGLGRTSAHWEPGWPARFASSLPAKSRVFLLDNPGTGTESHRAAPLSIAATAADVLSRFEALRREEGSTNREFAVFGLSLGGVIAVQLAAVGPPGLSAVVCCNSSQRFSPAWRRLRPRAMLSLLSSVTHSDRLAAERVVASVVVATPAKREAAALNWSKVLPAKKSAVLRQLVAASTHPPPPRLRVPLLVLCGAGDALCHPSCSAAIARHFGAVLKTHPTGGHELTLDEPAWVSASVREWLDSGMPSATANSGT